MTDSGLYYIGVFMPECSPGQEVEHPEPRLYRYLGITMTGRLKAIDGKRGRGKVLPLNEKQLAKIMKNLGRGDTFEIKLIPAEEVLNPRINLVEVAAKLQRG